MANFLHGVETIVTQIGPRPIRAVKTSVIALIGTAPIGPYNTPTVVLSDTQAAAFGPALAGFSIPQALDAIFDQGAGTVIVINVLDVATAHKTVITAEAVTLAGDVGTTVKPAWTIDPVVTHTSGTPTYVKGTDYTVDRVYGKITRVVGGAITANQAVKITYTYADPTKVVNTDIVGTVNGSGVRTGMQALLDSYNQFGFIGKILIAPGFSSLSTVSVAMIAMASKLRAIALLDAPVGTTYAAAIAGRGQAEQSTFTLPATGRFCCSRC